MWLLDRVAEERIEQAIARGELDDLPTAGQPLDLDDDRMVPPELRTAYRLLKNSGFLPEELDTRREIHDAEELLRIARTDEERANAGARLRALLARLDSKRGTTLTLQEAYYRRICERLG